MNPSHKVARAVTEMPLSQIERASSAAATVPVRFQMSNPRGVARAVTELPVCFVYISISDQEGFLRSYTWTFRLDKPHGTAMSVRKRPG